MAWYTPGSQHVHDLIKEVIDEYHPDLAETKARIGAVFCHADPDSDKPAMVKNGIRILAKIKKNSEADRIDGKPDATITFDAEHWKTFEEDEIHGRDQARALIDHELYHLVCKRDKETGRFLTDDQDRPKFDMRVHDWEITGFRAVAERHGRHSAEVQEAVRFQDEFGNLLFHFGAEHAVQRDMQFAEEVLGMTEQAVEEINREHEAVGLPRPFVGNKRKKPSADAAVAVANR